MVIVEFGMAEQQTLDSNSLFLKFRGSDFKENLERIKGYWNRKYHKDTYEWEVPFSCWGDIQQLYSDCQIVYINQPPKAKLVSESDIIEGMDFNGYNLYDYQLEGVRYGLNHHNFLLLDEQGLGKAQPINSVVYTPSGVTTIGSLNVEDYVLGEKGKVKVIGVYDRGILPVYKITFDDNTFAECSNDHLWSVYEKMNSLELKVVDTNYILSNFKKETFYIPVVERVDFNYRELSIDPYILGVILGDGNISCGSVDITINSEDLDIVNNINNYLKTGYKCVEKKCQKGKCITYTIANTLYDKQNVTNQIDYYCDGLLIGDCYNLFNYLSCKADIKCKFNTFKMFLSDYFNNKKRKSSLLKNVLEKYNVTRCQKKSFRTNYIKENLEKLNLYGCLSGDKFIPDIYKYNTYENRLKLLQGLLDTDGCVSKAGGVSYSSTSFRLLCDVKELCESFRG